MGFMVSVYNHKKYILFLNFSFLLLACSFLLIHTNSSKSLVIKNTSKLSNNETACKDFPDLKDYKAKCNFLKSHDSCVSDGYIDYLYIFYCNFGSITFLGHSLLFLWLLVLFYLLGNTASEYFCSSLENLSGLLKLSPVIAGVTLLSLGNGAPDVFASLVSFMGNETSQVGFNTVLGGASFTTCIVVGILSVLVKDKEIRVNKSAFIRDICFFVIVLGILAFILIHGEINLWWAILFWSLYIFYVIIVYTSDKFLSSKNDVLTEMEDCEKVGNSDLTTPILSNLEKGGLNYVQEEETEAEEERNSCFCVDFGSPYGIFLVILEMPLYLPRRLTIPVISEEKWSKPMAVLSVILAPVLLSVLWSPQDENSSFKGNLVFYGIGLLFGIIFGILAYFTTEKSNPPKKFQLPWLAAGFLMSVIWSYLIAQELVALLVSIGFIFQISPSILGLTVLAWGNSLGDLITNLTLAFNGGPQGAQIAISGCYAGPLFNILFGLGLSLVGSAWLQYPNPVLIKNDPYLLETLLFLGAGLIWALMVLPSRKMKLDGVLGGGLLVIYLVSMSIRLIQTLGSLQFEGTYP